MKLKLHNSKAGAPQDGPKGTNTPAAPPPSSAPMANEGNAGTEGGAAPHRPSLKLNFNSNKPAPANGATTQANGKKAKAAAGTGTAAKAKLGKTAEGPGKGKKRAANDDGIAPAPKRAASGAVQRLSLKGPSKVQQAEERAGGLGKITLKKNAAPPPRKEIKVRALNVKRPPPERLPGLGYDSEDSEAETDPAIQQSFVMRMLPGEDCDYVRDAVANGKIGLPEREGGADISIRFLDRDMRRATVKVRGRMYAAALVDLPCIVETMKSWDRKGWWKSSDLNQMLLVLGRCSSEDEARNFTLPREVDKETLQYPHGLTPPMQWVRKRRFRKRLSYKQIANVEEEVERLIKEDEATETNGGEVTYDYQTEREADDIEDGEDDDDDDDDDEPEEDEAIETVEGEDDDDPEENARLEAEMQAMFDAEGDEPEPSTSTPAPGPLEITTHRSTAADAQSSNRPANPPTPFVSTPLPLDSAAPSPSAQPPTTAATPTSAENSGSDDDNSSSSDPDSDDDDDDDAASSPTEELDEDARARATERNQQLEEVGDLENVIAALDAKIANLGNQLLKTRERDKREALVEDLRVKRTALGLEERETGEGSFAGGGGGTGE